MFVIVSAWNNLSDTERVLPLDRKMALTLKHAGVSITVTSITDIVAFGIGGSTVSTQTKCEINSGPLILGEVMDLDFQYNNCFLEVL
ncbi:hypothetical protein DPMN_105540 [Dreissena polymorpha]|uniref:SSD domain-containing protein n=1 Tax=Dreissena polymorpha TaxID=45954 RepID=A0A9D4QHT1_DREPO|nr:hypothetical protein DPMN_105540 [Dreissena polymorpha]